MKLSGVFVEYDVERDPGLYDGSNFVKCAQFAYSYLNQHTLKILDRGTIDDLGDKLGTDDLSDRYLSEFTFSNRAFVWHITRQVEQMEGKSEASNLNQIGS